MSKLWSKKEVEFLETKIDSYSLEVIAKKLNRTELAVKAKCIKLGLKNKSEYISANEAAYMIGMDRKVITRWKNKGLMISKKSNLKKSRTMINFNKFIEFLKDNQDLWDSREVSLYALGKEYEWLIEKRKRDLEINSKKNKPWSKYEEMILISLKKKGLSSGEIKEKIPGRSLQSINHKLTRLGLTKNTITWKDEEIRILIERDKEGIKDKDIAYELGRCEADIRYKRSYLKKRGLHTGKIGGNKIEG